MKKILISGLGGSFFPYLHDNLKSKYDLYYIDNNKFLKNIYPDYNFYHVPLVSSDSYFDLVSEIINDNGIEIYIPLIDEEIVPAIERFDKKLIVLSPKISFVNLCLNKVCLMKEMDILNISKITTFMADEYNEELKYPIFLKPNFGRGSRGILKIENKDQYDAYFKLNNEYKKSEILVQENIVGQEYTVGVLVNNIGDLILINTKKVISKKGITQIAVTESNELINLAVKKIVKSLNPTGPFNVQLFITPQKEIKIFEINPRFSTTSIMSYAADIDEISLYLNYYNKSYSLNIMEPRDGITLYRRWESLFFTV